MSDEEIVYGGRIGAKVEIVTKMDETTGEVLETKKVTNPMPMYARLGFDSKQALEAKRLDRVEEAGDARP